MARDIFDTFLKEIRSVGMGMKGKMMMKIYQVTHLILCMNKAKRTQLDQTDHLDMLTIININIDCLTEKGPLTPIVIYFMI